jgi:hypothetical protein
MKTLTPCTTSTLDEATSLGSAHFFPQEKSSPLSVREETGWALEPVLTLEKINNSCPFWEQKLNSKSIQLTSLPLYLLIYIVATNEMLL